MGAEISRQQFYDLKPQIENTTNQNNTLIVKIPPIEAEINKKTNEYNQLLSEKQKKLNLIKDSQKVLDKIQTNINSTTQQISQEQSLVKTINSFLFEYNENKSSTQTEIIGSTVEQLNQLTDEMDSINTNI